MQAVPPVTPPANPDEFKFVLDGLTQGLMDVANALAWKGPSGWYSQAWMSRADQSLRST